MTVPAPERLKRYLIVFLRGLSITLVTFVLTLFIGGFITNNILHKVYTATAQIQLRTRGIVEVSIVLNPQSFDPTFHAELEVLESPDVLLTVIHDLDLETAWTKRLSKSKEDQLTDQEAMAHLNKLLKLDVKRGTNIIAITVASDVPQEAAAIANAIADRYKTMRDIEDEQRANRGIDSYRDQIAQQQKVVEDKNAVVEKMRQEFKQKGIAIPPNLGSLQLETDLDARKKALLTAKEDYDARLVLLQSVINLPDDQFISTLDGLGRGQTDISSLRTDSAQKESEIDHLLKAGAKENDPQILALREEVDHKHKMIKDLIAGLRRAMRTDTEMAKSRVALLQKEVDDLTGQTRQNITNALVPFRDAQRQLLQQQSLLDALNVRLRQDEADRQLQESPVRIISRAEPPTAPNNSFAFIVTVVVAAFLSVTMASFVEMILLFSRASEGPHS